MIFLIILNCEWAVMNEDVKPCKTFVSVSSSKLGTSKDRLIKYWDCERIEIERKETPEN